MVQTKLSSDLYLAKILNFSTKLFFPCMEAILYCIHDMDLNV